MQQSSSNKKKKKKIAPSYLPFASLKNYPSYFPSFYVLHAFCSHFPCPTFCTSTIMATSTPDDLDLFIDNYTETKNPEAFLKRKTLPGLLLFLPFTMQFINVSLAITSWYLASSLPRVFLVTRVLIVLSVCFQPLHFPFFDPPLTLVLVQRNHLCFYGPAYFSHVQSVLLGFLVYGGHNRLANRQHC